MPFKATVPILVVVSLAWLAVVCLLAERFRIPSADGIMYSLPFAVARHPFDLGIPFLNNFQGYGSAWGHHWPGSMWLKGVFFQVIPYSRMADVAILSLFQLLSAITTGLLVWKATAKIFPALAASVILLSDRLLLLTCGGNRFESIALAAVLVLFCLTLPSSSNLKSLFRRWFGPFAAFLCPILHPYSLLLAGIIVVYHFFSAKSQGIPALKEWSIRFIAFLLGCLALAGWFIADSGAWNQFTTNMGIQKSFYLHWNSVIAGLSNYRIHGGLILWGSSLVCLLMLIGGYPEIGQKRLAPLSTNFRLLAPLLFLAVIVFHTLTRCENFNYLVFGTPFAVIIVCIALTRLGACMPPPARWLPATGIALIALLHASILPHRLFQFWKEGMPDLNQAYSDVLRELPQGKTVFIPHSLWPAASADKTHGIRWFTFPIASRREVRESYEHLAYANAKPGDILIIENIGAGQPDKFGHQPTFQTDPPAPERWRHLGSHKKIFAGSSPWGMDLSIYEFIR